MVQNICRFIATGLFSGLSPKAPGTAGTAMAVLLGGAAIALFPEISPRVFLFWLAIGSTVLGLVTVGWLYRSGFYREEDPQEVVIDEFAGFFITAFMGSGSLAALGIAFVLFRFFDILKPFPINRLEALPGAVGIMADDLCAGIFGGVILFLLGQFLGGF